MSEIYNYQVGLEHRMNQKTVFLNNWTLPLLVQITHFQITASEPVEAVHTHTIFLLFLRVTVASDTFSSIPVYLTSYCFSHDVVSDLTQH